MNTHARPAARRSRRIPIVAILLVAAFFVGMLGASRIYTILSSHAVPWHPSAGLSGRSFASAPVQTSLVVYVEVEWPGCIDIGDYNWLTPDVSYMPWSVTITLRTNNYYADKCTKPGADGRQPPIGYYLSPLSFQVQLSEPVGNRPLSDGSTFPATERYRP